VIFVALGAHVKLILDAEQGRDVRAAGEQPNPKNKHDALLELFHTIPLKKGFVTHQPSLSDFYLDVNYCAKAKSKRDKSAHMDPDADNIIGVAEPPPGIDAASAEPGLYDSAAAVTKSYDEIRRKYPK
jgi:hypothetical protein